MSVTTQGRYATGSAGWRQTYYANTNHREVWTILGPRPLRGGTPHSTIPPQYQWNRNPQSSCNPGAIPKSVCNYSTNVPENIEQGQSDPARLSTYCDPIAELHHKCSRMSQHDVQHVVPCSSHRQRIAHRSKIRMQSTTGIQSTIQPHSLCNPWHPSPIPKSRCNPNTIQAEDLAKG